MEQFKFIDLFAGIGGTRLAFEKQGAVCVFSSEIDRFAQETYRENFNETPHGDITLTSAEEVPDHDCLVAGFPCQPFSLAGVSKNISLGNSHGFEHATQGTLFFEIHRILREKRPQAFLLENVKNLKSHDKGNTFKIILDSLIDLGYRVHHQVIDAVSMVPQHRERIYIVGFLDHAIDFQFPAFPIADDRPYRLRNDILEQEPDPKYTISKKLWDYLQAYAAKHRAKGNGFGYGLVDPNNPSVITRTLSSRYHKDGAEILIETGGETPRRLTPKECSRLMGFPDSFVIPVSDTQAYRQFGNSVVVPIVEQIAAAIIKASNAGSQTVLATSRFRRIWNRVARQSKR